VRDVRGTRTSSPSKEALATPFGESGLYFRIAPDGRALGSASVGERCSGPASVIVERRPLRRFEVARYRLRFLLQEFDLPRGTTLIGRSSDCQVTIEDPLVSRQHARILNDGEVAKVEDLGSRNGVKLNGIAVKQEATLKDGDRLRIGTQELVFCKVEATAASSAKTTGFLRHCSTCRLPYPREMVACPNCGAAESADSVAEEDTLSGQFGASSQGAWSVQLLIEVLEKALSLGRAADAERILRRATAQIEERVLEGDKIDPRQLQALSIAAAKMSLDSGEPTWGSWVAQIHRRMSVVPPRPVVESLAGLVARYPDEVGDAVEDLAAHCRGTLHAMSPEQAESVSRLEQLRAPLDASRASLLGTGPNPAIT
jgi:hypothetical protein